MEGGTGIIEVGETAAVRVGKVVLLEERRRTAKAVGTYRSVGAMPRDTKGIKFKRYRHPRHVARCLNS